MDGGEEEGEQVCKVSTLVCSPGVRSSDAHPRLLHTHRLWGEPLWHRALPENTGLGSVDSALLQTRACDRPSGAQHKGESLAVACWNCAGLLPE